MKNIIRFSLVIFVTILALPMKAQNDLPKVLLRTDDIGMDHSVNMALKKLADTGIPFSTSVLFVCPWYQEAVDILKDNPQVTVGVHLALNAEWKYYRWGPVLGREGVPSLVNDNGFFRASIDEFLKSDYHLDEVERELEAQIQRALNSGLKVTYVDCHMGTAESTPELRAIVEKLADKYGLGISSYFDENYKSMWGVSVDTKQAEFMDHLNNHLEKDQVNLIELHIAVNNPEMQALVDLNSNLMNSANGQPQAGEHRQTELNMLLDPSFHALIGKKFQLVTYSDLVKSAGLDSMKAPVNE